MNKNLFKKVISLVIALMMIMPNMPMSVYANEATLIENEATQTQDQLIENETQPGEETVEENAEEPPTEEEPPVEEPPVEEPEEEEELEEDLVEEEPIFVETASVTINHILLDGYETLGDVTEEEHQIGDVLLGEDLISQKLLEQDLEFLFSEPEEITLVEGENNINLYYGIEFFMGENPDGLLGPEYIDSPDLVEYADGELGPFPNTEISMFNSIMNFGMGISSHPDDHDNIEWPNPGALDIDKRETPVEGFPNRWRIDLTLEGKDIPKTSDIVLVIDRSGSMSGSKLTDAKDAAISFVNTLLNDTSDLSTRIAVVSFAGDVTTHNSDNPFRSANNKEGLINAINGLNASGGTHTQAGIRRANTLLNGSNAEYKNIVLLSDGQPTYSYAISNVNNRLNSTYFTNTTGSTWHSRDNLSSSAFNYNSTVGNGSSLTQYIGYQGSGFNIRYYYYNNGNSAVAESRFAKEDKTVYTIALNAGTAGNNVLNRVASPEKAYTGTEDDLESIFATIAGDISYAATNATIIDPLGDMFNLPGGELITPSNISEYIHVNRGTVTWDNVTETITWTLDTISEGNPATMWYIVEIEPTAISGQVYPTNKHTYVGYENALGADAQKTFPEPEVGIDAGTIRIYYYRVNADGQPINSQGTVVPQNQAQLQVSTYQQGTDLQFNTPYSVGGPTTLTIGEVNYQYNLASEAEEGDVNPTTVTLTPEVPSREVWFGYMEVTDLTVTFDENYTGAPPVYTETTEANTSLGSNMPGDPTRTGYTFVEWNTAADGNGVQFTSGTIVTDDVTVYAQWTVNNYTLTYADSLSEEIYGTQNYDFGATVTAIADPEKDGYTFNGWQPEVPGTMPADDVTVYAQWTVNNYTLTYADSLSEEIYGTQNYDFGATVTAIADPEKDGYTFNGWQPEVPSTMPADDVTVYAQWTVNNYTLTYADSLSEEIYGTQNYDFGATVTAIADPEKDGYTFNGWQPEVPGTMPADDVTVYAQWTVNNYTLTYADSLSEEIYGTQNYDFGATVTAIADPEKDGYTFNGWQPEVPGTMPADDVTVYAQWTVNNYTLTYADSLSEEIYGTQNYDFGATVTAIADPEKDGYTFNGWQPEVPGTMPADDVTVYAQWTVNNYTLTYADSLSEEIYGTQNYDFGATVTAIADPEKDGYTFNGWQPEVPGTMPADDVTVYAQWTVNNYTLTYADSLSEEIYGTQNYDFGATVTAIADPEKDGYTFNGWQPEVPGTMPADDVTVYAQWTVNNYTLTYADSLSEEIYGTQNYDFGATVTAIADPEKDGYTFNGWQPEVPGTMPADDVTVYAQWTVNNYTLTYADSLSEEIYGTQNYDFGATVTAIADPEKDGYTFNGWQPEVPGTMPADDVTVYAQWTVNNYTLTYADSLSEEIYGTQNYDFGATVTAIADPEKDGYTFNGWQPEVPGTMPADDVTVYAQWTVNNYTLTYADSLSEEIYGTQNYDFGATVTAIADPEKDGYTFNGWQPEVPGTMPADDVTVYAQWARLEVSKTGEYVDANDDGIVNVGDRIDYTITVENTGNVTLTNVSVTDPLITLTGPSGDTNEDGNLDVGETWTYTGSYDIIQEDIDAGGVENTVTVDTEETPPVEEDEETLLEQDPEISIDKSADREIFEAVGEIITYTYEITNTGNVTLEGPFTVVDDKIGEIDASSAPEALGPGESFELTAEYEVTQADMDRGYVTNVVTVTGEDEDLPPGEDEETVEGEQDPEISIDKSADREIFEAVGEIITYTYEITNTGNVTLEGPFTVVDDKIGEIDASSAPEALGPGESFELTAEYEVTQADMDRGYVTNVVTVTGEDEDLPPGEDEETVEGEQDPEISIDKSADREIFEAVGEIITYTYEITNTGNVTLEGPFTVVDDKIGEIDASSAPEALGPGEGFELTAEYEVTQADMDRGYVTNVVTVTGEDEDLPPGEDEETVEGEQDPEISIDKSADREIFEAVGEIITYTYEITNTGNVTLEGPFTVVDDKIGEIDASSAPEALGPGESFELTAEYEVTQADMDRGYVTNVVTVTGEDEDLPPGEDEETVEGEQDPNLEVVKEGTWIDANQDGFADVGDVIDYTITVKNIGNVTITNLTLTDPMFGEAPLELDSGDDNENGMLDVDETWIFTGSYVITREDLDAEQVTNIALVVSDQTDEEEVTEIVPLIEGFVVKYDSNGGSGSMIDSNLYASGAEVTVLDNGFTRYNYRFTGWNTAANGSGISYAAGDEFAMPAHDVTLYAQWQRRSTPPGPVVIDDPEPPLAELERFDHFAYVIGYPEGDVRPLNNITREEVAMIFYRLLTDDSRNALLSDVNPFTDMDQHHAWSNRAVSTLYNAGILSGYPDGTFRPSDPITRAEFATIAAKFDELELGSASEFTDIFGHWAEKYITSSENKGWIKGYPDMTFKPEQDITRAEAMTLINNVLERGVPAENIHPDAIFWPDNPDTEWYYEAVMEATNSHDYIYEDDGNELWTGMKPNKVWP